MQHQERNNWRRERNWIPTFSRSIAKRFALVRYGSGQLQPIRLDSFGLLSWVYHVGARRSRGHLNPAAHALSRSRYRSARVGAVFRHASLPHDAVCRACPGTDPVGSRRLFPRRDEGGGGAKSAHGSGSLVLFIFGIMHLTKLPPPTPVHKVLR
jgi:hypothetical protein